MGEKSGEGEAVKGRLSEHSKSQPHIQTSDAPNPRSDSCPALCCRGEKKKKIRRQFAENRRKKQAFQEKCVFGEMSLQRSEMK